MFLHTDLLFKGEATVYGRNGKMKAWLAFQADNAGITIMVINSRGVSPSVKVEIPLEDCEEFIGGLIALHEAALKKQADGKP
jgi:hypothetical protein